MNTSSTGPLATRRTFSSVTRSKYSGTVWRSWWTATTVRPSSRRRRRRSTIARSVTASTPWNGSSIRNTASVLDERPCEEDALLLAAGELADLTAGQRLHPDLLERRHRRVPLAPAGAPEPAERAVAAHRDDIEDARGKSQSTLPRCGTYATRPRCSSYGRPNTATRPAAGRTSPRIARISVDLPAPFGPTMAASVPDGTVRSTSHSAGRSP